MLRIVPIAAIAVIALCHSVKGLELGADRGSINTW